ncbi:MAG: alpha,alpha-trehalase TreA [Saprospiraceae bacterium]|nr:alpha,alpha-trehalase TreA [Saprospiraceae bacterium]
MRDEPVRPPIPPASSLIPTKMHYIHELGPLFHDVQMAQVFPDGKTFPDCLPKANLQTIAEQYEIQKTEPGFDLKAFVAAHFSLPPVVGSDFVRDTSRTPAQHVEALWDVLTRLPDAEPSAQSSLLPLPNPYVVPGGRFREVYYWDSYFTMLGLRVQGRWDLIENMVDNFAHLLNTYGFVPNGNRSYYLGRSQPPFFSLMVRLLAEHLGDRAYLRYLPAIANDYKFWMKGLEFIKQDSRAVERLVGLGGNHVLNRHWDAFDTPRPESYREDVELSLTSMQPSPQLYRNIRAAAESGWDFSSRWFGDRTGFASICTTDIVPIDLNCLLWHLEDTIVHACDALGRASEAEILSKATRDRQAAILQFCWDETDGFFFDYNFKLMERTNHRTLAAMYPLFFKLATQKQADSVAEILENDFLKPGGLATTLLETGQQWDAPNGWAPLQWISYIGLKNYGHDRLAAEVRSRWLNTVESVYRKTGKMTEKYNVLHDATNAGGGEYENQDGFGWTNGVYLGMRDEG